MIHTDTMELIIKNQVSATLQETGLGVAALEFAHVVHGVHIRHDDVVHPVSYTHLDVYKRQVLISATSFSFEALARKVFAYVITACFT